MINRLKNPNKGSDDPQKMNNGKDTAGRATHNPVEFYFDFSSPYGYFASSLVDQAFGECSRHVEWKPILLGLIYKITGSKPLVDLPLRGDYALRDWERLSRYFDIPYHHPTEFPIPTQIAARGFYWLDAQDPERAKLYARRVYAAYFIEGRDIREKDVIVDVAESVGADGDAMRAAVDTDAWRDRVRVETEAAVRKGVFGSPFFIVDGEGFWGCDRLNMVVDWAKRGGW